jgi:phage recombination protein Bet
MADKEEPKQTTAVATTRKAPTLADLAPKGIDGRLWVKTLKDNLMSSKAGEPTDEELFYFARVSQASGLDPAKREIYAIFRNVKQKDGTWKPKMSIQTGIDGLRVVAERSGKYAGSDEPEYDYDDEYKITVNVAGSNRQVPNKARVSVKKIVGGQIVSTTRSAKWEEFYPGDQQGTMWKKMPEVMLAKVAEAQALRAAFPNVTEGLYIDEEMQQADIDVDTNIDLPAIRKRIASAATDDDLMDILGDYTPDIQKKITPWVDAKAKELRSE